MSERGDDNPALFVYERKPFNRLKKSGIELIIKKIVQRVTEPTTHITPHTFRHTTATTAIDRGMNVVDVSKLLGHSKVETTMEYITSNINSIKTDHRNYII